MHTASSENWTQLTEFISYDDNRNVICAFVVVKTFF